MPSITSLIDIFAPLSGQATSAPTMGVSPVQIKKSSQTLVTFTGRGTTWLTAAPSLSAAGVAGVSIGTVTVVSDTSCSGTVTTGTATGTVVWTDATSGAQAYQDVTKGGNPHQMLRPARGFRFPRRKGS